jgi:GTP 3',8-cyclase
MATSLTTGVEKQSSGVTDKFGRPLRDLRISVADRCNFRCIYCMPKEIFGSDYQFLDRKELLTFEEIDRLARIFVGHGVEKIRLTGGEPLVRRNLENLIEMLAAIPGLDLTLTTNGSMLARKAEALKAAGLNRVTVSLDSLDNEIFKSMNDVGFPVEKVLAGIDEAARVGLNPIKINMVVKRGVNEQSILPMARYFREAGHILRFIEYMDVGHSNGWKLDEVVPAAEIMELIHAEMPLEQIPPNYPGEVANRWRYVGDTNEVLRRVHQGAYIGRGQALHLPVRSRRPGPAAADARRDLGRRPGGSHPQDLVRSQGPLLGDPLLPHRGASQGGDVVHRGLSYSQPFAIQAVNSWPGCRLRS